MTYNRSKIMKRAWQIVKSNPNWQKLGLAFWMRRALWDAWAEAKREALTVKEKAQQDLQLVLLTLENKNWKTMTRADHDKLAGLQRAA
jgi:hypothetical protein